MALSICYIAALFVTVTIAHPKIRVIRQTEETVAEEPLGLPSNSTSIRANIDESFSCEDRVYGYYADVGNDCQVFHVCLPVELADGNRQVYKWSFICPEQTIFNQESFTCVRPQDSVLCEESPQYYNLNEKFGQTESPLTEPSNLL